MIRLSIPVINVSFSKAAEEFYSGQLGFEKRFAYRPEEFESDPCYMGFVRDSAWIHISSFSGDGVAGCAVYLVVDDVNALHSEFAAKGIDVGLEPTDQRWGNREMHIEDPDGNSIRFVQERSP